MRACVEERDRGRTCAPKLVFDPGAAAAGVSLASAGPRMFPHCVHFLASVRPRHKHPVSSATTGTNLCFWLEQQL